MDFRYTRNYFTPKSMSQNYRTGWTGWNICIRDPIN